MTKLVRLLFILPTIFLLENLPLKTFGSIKLKKEIKEKLGYDACKANLAMGKKLGLSSIH